MSADAASAKKKPLFFKRRAVPISSSAPPISLDDSDSDPDLAGSQRKPKTSGSTGSGNTGNSGVDLFRRSKQFFPRAIEEQSRRLQAERQNQRVASDGSNNDPLSPEVHGVKRRKVSLDPVEILDDEDHKPAPASPTSPTSASKRRRPRSVASLSPEVPSPPRTRDRKGKGIATRHAVNAEIKFTDLSFAPPPPASTSNDGDDSIIVLEDEEVVSRVVRDAASKADEGEEYIKGKEAMMARGPGTDNDTADDDDVDDDVVEAIDPEFEEYILRARARDAAARAAQAAQDAMNSSFGAAASTSSATASTAINTAAVVASQSYAIDSPSPSAGNGTTLAQSTHSAAGEQTYRIFITPHFPGTVPPLIANVRMDQKMQYVQAAFLQHAHSKGLDLTSEDNDSVLLTWKGSKIYSWTTGQSLGIRPDSHGRFKDESDSGGLLSRSASWGSSAAHQLSGFLSGGLHLEIWTQPLYDSYLREQERRRLRNMGEMVDDDLESLSDDGEDVAAAGGVNGNNNGDGNTTRQSIRLVLVSKNYEKLNMTVHPDTTVTTMISVFRDQRGIDSSQAISIHWEGDELDPETTVADADMEDMDSVEVHIN